jgi:hypothetical protein
MVAENLEPNKPLKSPYPYFGAKSRIAPLIWKVFGNCRNYVEPFAGSLAVLLARPQEHFETDINPIETVNELNPYISNFWRAIKADPEETAYYADFPVIETDLHARHLWLVNQGEFRETMMTDPHHYDTKIAGWYVWGLSQWIGHGWCSFEHMTVDGKPWKRGLALSSAGQGINTVSNRLPYLHRANKKLNPDPDNQPSRKLPKFPPGGVHRQGLVDFPANQPSRQARRLSTSGQGINKVTRQLPFVGNAGRGDASPSRRDALYQYFEDLANRLRNVRVTCGDFERVLGPSVTEIGSTNAVFLDPPYLTNEEIYGMAKGSPALRALEWCKANWNNPNLRIALCGYEGEFEIPSDWRVIAWKGAKGYSGSENKNRERERIWLSPACLPLEERKQLSLW